MQNQQNRSERSFDETNNNQDGPTTKRHATKGQWQTPPVPFFPSTETSKSSNNNATSDTGVVPISNLTIPNSSDDYAKALQEAYRQGALAYAKAMEENKQPSVSNTKSSGQLSSSTINTVSSSVGHISNTTNIPNSNTTIPSVLPTSATIMNSSSQQQQQQQPQHQLLIPSTNFIQKGDNNPFFMPSTTSPHNNPKSNITTNATTSLPPVITHHIYKPNTITSTSSRSISLPDISSYADKADSEEAKRLKRLERNRASARLRRLKKKNLVESYEVEVGVLENALSKLRSHKWGVYTDASSASTETEAILEALSMERGQQSLIDTTKRNELISDILKQQQEQVRNVMDCQLENMVLGWLVRNSDHEFKGDAKVKSEHEDNHSSQEQDDFNSLANELHDLLNLTDEQKDELKQATEGIEQERRAIEVVDASLNALLTNPWLMDNDVEEFTEQFTSILNPTQVSKFLLWADHNAEAIDMLDYVNAPSENAPPLSGPVFTFGLNDNLQGED